MSKLSSWLLTATFILALSVANSEAQGNPDIYLETNTTRALKSCQLDISSGPQYNSMVAWSRYDLDPATGTPSTGDISLLAIDSSNGQVNQFSYSGFTGMTGRVEQVFASPRGRNFAAFLNSSIYAPQHMAPHYGVVFSTDSGQSYIDVNVRLWVPMREFIPISYSATPLNIDYARAATFASDGYFYIVYYSYNATGTMNMVRIDRNGNMERHFTLATSWPGFSFSDPTHGFNSEGIFIDITATEDAIVGIHNRPATWVGAGPNPQWTDSMMGWFRLENGTNDLQTGWIGYIPNSTTAPPLPRPAGRPMDPHRWKAAIDSDGRNIGITFPKPTVLVNGDVVIGYESFILPYDESLPNRYFPNHAPSGAGYATDPREIEDRFDISPLLSDGSTPPSTNMGAIYGMAMPGAPAGGPYPNQIELLLHTKQDMDNDVNSIRTVRFDPTVDTPSTVSIMRREDYAESQLPAPYKLHLRPESEYTSYFGIDQGGTVASFCGKVWTNDPVNEIGANVFAVDVN